MVSYPKYVLTLKKTCCHYIAPTVVSLSNWDLGVLVFVEGGEPEYSGFLLLIFHPQFKYVFHIFPFISVFILYGYITNSQYDQLPVGLIAQLVENCTGIAEVMGSNPVEA